MATPRLLMQLPFLLAFISLLSLSHPHLLSTAKEELSIAHKPFIYETVAASFLASDSQGGSSSLPTDVPEEENDILVDDAAEKEVPSIAKPFIYESVAASLYSRANTEGSHVPSFIYESVAASLYSTARGGSSLRDNIGQEEDASLLDEGDKPIRDPIIRKEEPNSGFIYESVLGSMHLEAHGSYLRDNAPQAENFLHFKDGSKYVQSGAKRDEPIIDKPSFIYESVGASVRSGTRRGSFIRDNMENAFLLDNGGKQVGKSPSKVASSTQAGGGLLRDSVPQEKYHFLRDDGRMRPISKADHDGKSMKLPISNELIRLGRENLRTVVDDSVESMMKKYHAKAGYPNEEYLRMVVGDSSNSMIEKEYPPRASSTRGNPDDENLRMVVGDSSNSMIEKEYPPRASSTRGNPDDKNLRMVVGDSSNNMIQKGYRTSRGRSRSCTSNSDICSQLAHEQYVNHIVLYGQPSRVMRNRRPACCGGTCVDLSHNGLNCGICNLPCLLLETCCDGECVNLDINDSNCGECGNVCPTSTSCKMGMCGY